MNTDEKYMRIAIDLAKKAEGLTSPNPIVGALIVKDGKISGRGYHERAGLAHAEINALLEAGRKAKGATLYVTLEPCDHFGRTPPCTDSIIKSGIRNVIIGMKDPNPINNGRGIKKLNRNNIKTKVGVLEDEAASLNRPYIKFITKKMPYVTVKIAQSLDGKIATKTGDSKWITREDSRRYVHELRGKVDAVMVGVNTVVKDDPLLLSKSSKGKEPSRIIVDSKLETPVGARIFSKLDKSPVLIAATELSKTKMKEDFRKKRGVEVLVGRSKKGRVDLTALLKRLAGRDISHILVEGGGELVASLLEEGLVDRFLFFVAPKIIGGRGAITSVEGAGVDKVEDAHILKNMRVRQFSRDILIEGEVSSCSQV